MVLSVLTLTRGGGNSTNILPVHRWSAIIEQGLAKEQMYKEEIARLKREAERERKAAELAEKLALLAKEETDQSRKREEEALLRAKAAEEMARNAAKQEAEARMAAALAEQARKEAEKAAREAAEQARLARERESEAVKRAEQARLEAKMAEARAREAREKELEALNKVSLAEKSKIQAEMAAKQALERVAEARKAAAEAEAARRQAEEQMKAITENTAEAEKERLLALQRAKAAEEAVKIATERARFAEQAADRESDRLARIEKELRIAQAEAAAARERAARAQEAVQQKTEQVKMAERDKEKLQSKLEEVVQNAQKLQLVLAETERNAEDAAKRLERIEREKKQSIWVMLPKALRQFDVHIVARDLISYGSNWVNDHSLQLPLVYLNNVAFAVIDIGSVGFDWVLIGRDRITGLDITFRETEKGKVPMRMQSDILVHKDEPRVLYLPVINSNGEGILKPVGIERIRAEQIIDGILFKKDDASESVRVQLTPTKGSFVAVSKKLDAKTSTKPAVGDYVTTANGLYVGVMVTKNLCYVLPQSLVGKQNFLRIPITRKPGEIYFNSFSLAADRVKEMVKKMPKD